MESEQESVDRSYRLHEKLGEGGMGTVYRATQLVTGQEVALKLVPERLFPGIENDSTGPHVGYRLALAREFQTLASLHHPNVIRVLSYGFDEHLGPYFVMDILEAAHPLVDSGISYSEETQVKLVAQLLRALAYIHRRGVIHRDIKPGAVGECRPRRISAYASGLRTACGCSNTTTRHYALDNLGYKQ